MNILQRKKCSSKCVLWGSRWLHNCEGTFEEEFSESAFAKRSPLISYGGFQFLNSTALGLDLITFTWKVHKIALLGFDFQSATSLSNAENPFKETTTRGIFLSFSSTAWAIKISVSSQGPFQFVWMKNDLALNQGCLKYQGNEWSFRHGKLPQVRLNFEDRNFYKKGQKDFVNSLKCQMGWRPVSITTCNAYLES